MSLEFSLAAGARLIWLCAYAAVYCGSTVFIFLLAFAAYRLYLHPLSRVPGPKLAAVSNTWHAIHARNGRMATLGRNLHKKYGPVVRVGPGEVWLNSPEAYKTIYSTGSGFEKADFYREFFCLIRGQLPNVSVATSLSRPKVDWALRLHFPDTLDFLSERDMKRYRLQRRLIGPVYQASHLSKYEAVVDDVVERAVSRLKSLKGTEVDLKEWMHIIAVECLGAVVLSWSPGMLKDGTDRNSSSHSYQGWRRKSVFGLFPMIARLEFCSRTVGRFWGTLWGVTFKTPKNFKPFFPDVNSRVMRRIRTALRSEPPKDGRRDLVYDLIQLHKEKPQFTETYLKKMAITNFGAGHETMASTLTSIVAMIASHSEVHTRVTQEVRQVTKLESGNNTSQLAYTQAAIKEAKRLHPVISMSLARQVPDGGVNLDGYWLPGGTTVGCNPVALHRNEDICGPNADTYEPDRWLDVDAARRMERFSLSWGGGARTCPGRHLAELVISRVIPAVFTEFDVQVTIPPEREIPSYFLSMLVGVKARFLEKEAAPMGMKRDEKQILNGRHEQDTQLLNNSAILHL